MPRTSTASAKSFKSRRPQADITGSVFGTPLVDPFGDIRILSEAVIVITRN